MDVGRLILKQETYTHVYTVQTLPFNGYFRILRSWFLFSMLMFFDCSCISVDGSWLSGVAVGGLLLVPGCPVLVVGH